MALQGQVPTSLTWRLPVAFYFSPFAFIAGLHQLYGMNSGSCIETMRLKCNDYVSFLVEWPAHYPSSVLCDPCRYLHWDQFQGHVGDSMNLAFSKSIMQQTWFYWISQEYSVRAARHSGAENQIPGRVAVSVLKYNRLGETGTKSKRGRATSRRLMIYWRIGLVCSEYIYSI